MPCFDPTWSRNEKKALLLMALIKERIAHFWLKAEPGDQDEQKSLGRILYHVHGQSVKLHSNIKYILYLITEQILHFHISSKC